MHIFSAENPILNAWSATLRQHGRKPAIQDSAGSVLRTFADIEQEALDITQKLPGTCGIAVVELGNSPSLPGTLLALWRCGFVPLLVEQGVSVSIPGVVLHIRDSDFLAVESAPAVGEADFLKLTSGTTGAPRAIRFSAAQLLADCDAVCDTMGITDSDLNYGMISWAHSYGFSNLVLPLLCRGVRVVATSDRLPRAILNGLASTRATVFPGVPVFFRKLEEIASAPLPALRLCISAGAMLPADVAVAFREKFGVKVHTFYGASECGGICYDAAGNEAPEGFVGHPMKGVRVQPETGGRIRVLSSSVALGYWPDAEPSILDEGVYSPTDLVDVTPDGCFLRGRESDFINVAGRKLNPAEVERVLREHPGVSDVVVFGVPNALRGEEPCALVVGSAGTQELLSFAAARLATWQLPREIRTVGAVPLNERGKVSRRELSEKWQRDRTETRHP